MAYVCGAAAFWLANLRANAVDIIVGLSAVVFIIQADSALGQVVWAALYAGWLLVVNHAVTHWAPLFRQVLPNWPGWVHCIRRAQDGRP